MFRVGVFRSCGVDDTVVGSQEAEDEGQDGSQDDGCNERGQGRFALNL